MHDFAIEKRLETKLKKLHKKDGKTYTAVMAKIAEIVSSPKITRYKNLRKPLQDFKRVHIQKSFVLVFKYDQTKDLVKFYDFEHHDKAYKT
ncbi:MAG: addiction module toxin RelE [Candidatus Diapherotrites archaeon]|nr:addiction module toxin RelE [Candidatus Diapherotrites archaeon]